MIDLSSFPVDCDCGRPHRAPLKSLHVESGALGRLVDCLGEVGAERPFVVMDEHTREAAGERALALMRDAGIPCTVCCLPGEPRLLPNEEFLARIQAELGADCDFVLGIGSGVINDLCKMVGLRSGLRTGIVATAPSMDGYASNSSAMELAGVKTTVYNACPVLILCDTEILRHAPVDMLRSGFGDMVAKVLSIAEWRMAHLVTGEYYCDRVAQMMLAACQQVVRSAQGIMLREEPAIRQMTEGLVLSGIAMSFAGVSRPASGMEHTISHLLEMFALARGARPAFHGLQVGYGTRMALLLYQAAVTCQPSREGCNRAFARFDQAAWAEDMRRVFGAQAEGLIMGAAKEGRNGSAAFQQRSAAALAHWSEIRKLFTDVLSQRDELLAGLDLMQIPQLHQPQLLGYTPKEAADAFFHSRDLRQRYVFSSLCWDLGLMEEMTHTLHKAGLPL